jgi:hypothetical protein
MKGLLVIALWAFLPCAQAETIKCWTNSDGIRECGNSVPPEYAQQGHEELNRLGITVNRIERAKTKEELEAEARLAEQKEQRQRVARARAERDRVLLHTFSNEDEIIMARDGKLAIIENEINIARQNINITKKNLDALTKSAAQMERNGKPVTDSLRSDIASAQSQVKGYGEFIAKKQREKERFRRAYAADLKRFRQLKSGSFAGKEQAGAE